MDRWTALGIPFDDFTKSRAKERKIEETIEEKIKQGKIFVTGVEGPTKVFEGKKFTFKVVGFTTTEFKVSDIASKIKWGFTVDGGNMQMIREVGRPLGNREVYINWQIPNLR